MRYYIRIRSDEDWNVKFGDTIRYLQSLGRNRPIYTACRAG
jgi:hypothetical protein